MIKTWFSLISVVLLSSLAVLLANFEINSILYWISLLILTITIALQCIVYLEKRKPNDLQTTYSEFLKRKDKQIEELKQKNDLMFKTAMKKSQSEIELTELKRKLEEKMKEQ